LGKIFAEHSPRSLFDGLADEPVSVHLRTFDGHEEVTVLYPTGIDIYSRYVHLCIADDAKRLDIL
jgi:hypothetical protein